MRLEDYDDDDCMVYVGVNYSVRLPGTALWPGGGGLVISDDFCGTGVVRFFSRLLLTV
jgi:hypothetical protein